MHVKEDMYDRWCNILSITILRLNHSFQVDSKTFTCQPFFPWRGEFVTMAVDVSFDDVQSVIIERIHILRARRLQVLVIWSTNQLLMSSVRRVCIAKSCGKACRLPWVTSFMNDLTTLTSISTKVDELVWSPRGKEWNGITIAWPSLLNTSIALTCDENFVCIPMSA